MMFWIAVFIFYYTSTTIGWASFLYDKSRGISGWGIMISILFGWILVPMLLIVLFSEVFITHVLDREYFTNKKAREEYQKVKEQEDKDYI